MAVGTRVSTKWGTVDRESKETRGAWGLGIYIYSEFQMLWKAGLKYQEEELLFDIVSKRALLQVLKQGMT